MDERQSKAADPPGPPAAEPDRTGRPVLWLSALIIPVLMARPSATEPGASLAGGALAMLLAALPSCRLPVLLRGAVALAAGAVMSALWSLDPGQSVITGLTWLGWLAIPALGHPEVHRGLRGGAAVAMALVLWAVAGQLSGDLEAMREAADLIPVEEARLQTSWWMGSRRVFGPFNSPDILAGYLVVMAPVVLAVAAQAPTRTWPRAILGGLGVAGMAALLATRSAGGLLAVALGGTAVAAARSRRPAAVLAGGLAVAVGLVGLAAWLRSGRPMEGVLGAGLSRLEDWHTAVMLGASRPLLGAGAGAFESAFNARDVPYERYTPFAHGAVPQLAAELGLPAAVLALLAYAALCAWALRRARTCAARELPVLWGILAGVAHHQLDYDLHSQAGGALWVALALALQGWRPPAAPARSTPWRFMWACAGAMAVTVAAATMLCARGVPRLPSDVPDVSTSRAGARMLHFDARAQIALLDDLALSMSVPGLPDGELQQLRPEAVAVATHAVTLAPFLPATHLRLGRALVAAGDVQAALQAYSTGVRASCCNRALREERMQVAAFLGLADLAEQDRSWVEASRR